MSDWLGVDASPDFLMFVWQPDGEPGLFNAIPAKFVQQSSMFGTVKCFRCINGHQPRYYVAVVNTMA